MSQKLPTEAECKRAASMINDVMEPVFGYARRKHLLDRLFSEYEAAEDLWEGFPERWEPHVLGMLAAGSVLTRPDRVAAAIRSIAKEVRDDLVKMMRRWRSRPWAWAFFQVIEDLGQHRLRIAPLGAPPAEWSDPGAWKEILLHSASISDNYRQGRRLFFTQIADAGPAFETYGAIIPFLGVDADDILFAADVIDLAGSGNPAVPLLGVADPSTPVSDIVADNPIPFLALMRYSEVPVIRGPHGEIRHCVSRTDLPTAEASIGRLPSSEGAWRAAVDAAGAQIAGIILDEIGCGISFGQGSDLHDPRLYLSWESGRGYLEAKSWEAYDRGRSAVADILDFPEVPDVSAGGTIYLAMMELTGLDRTLLDECGLLRNRYAEDLDEEISPPEMDDGDFDPESTPSSIEELQAISERLITSHNEGRHESDEAIAADLDIDVAVVKNIRLKLQDMFDRISASTTDIPSADRFGLSPDAFRTLIGSHAPSVPGVLQVRSVAELRPAGHLITEAPHYRTVRWLLERALSDDGLRATNAGYIAPPVVRIAFEERVVPVLLDMDLMLMNSDAQEDCSNLYERRSPKRELDYPGLLRARILAERIGVLQLSGDRFVCTDRGMRYFEDPATLYQTLLTTAFHLGDWGQPHSFEIPMVQHEFMGFLFYAAGRLCDVRREDAFADDDWVPMSLLMDRFAAAVPMLAETFRTEAGPTSGRITEMGMRTWTRAMIDGGFVRHMGVRFGLLEIVSENGLTSHFRTTPLYDTVFDRGQSR